MGGNLKGTGTGVVAGIHRGIPYSGYEGTAEPVAPAVVGAVKSGIVRHFGSGVERIDKKVGGLGLAGDIKHGERQQRRRYFFHYFHGIGLFGSLGSVGVLRVNLHVQIVLRNGLNYESHGEFYTSIIGGVGCLVLPLNVLAVVELNMAISEAKIDGRQSPVEKMRRGG